MKTAMLLAHLAEVSMERGHNDVGRETELPPAPDFSEELRTKELALGPVRHSEVTAVPRCNFQFVVPRSTHDKSRYIRAAVRRAVWERDEGRCTFVSMERIA